MTAHHDQDHPPLTPWGVVVPPALTVHFDYSGSLPHGGATWGAVICQGEHRQELGGFLSPHQASEEGALDEVLRLLWVLDIQTAMLFTDDPALVTRRAHTLPATLQLVHLNRNHPRQQWAHRTAQRYRPSYCTLVEWGQQQPRPASPTPPPPSLQRASAPPIAVVPPPRQRFAPLSAPCTFQYRRKKKGDFTLHLRLADRLTAIAIGHTQQRHWAPLMPEQQARIVRQLREALLRGYGPEVEPYLAPIEARLLQDCAKLSPSMSNKSPAAVTTLCPLQLGLGRAQPRVAPKTSSPVPVLAAFSCRRISPTHVKLSYARARTVRVIRRPAAEWAGIVSELLLKAGFAREEITPHLRAFVEHLYAAL
ncbi:hypothetical protein [Deinococcus petrolearius]|uniref:RNase H type-1 domain-containing protein n=1 Tax=Deinococcus petrolearius TaxID=1751295 RepID=A0ABW1DKG4_9DEIO